MPEDKKEVWLALCDVRSAHNVGAIFRTAATLAPVSKLWLVGLTPGPCDRFGRTNAAVRKTALGAEQVMPWAAVKSFAALAKRARAAGGAVVALEQAPASLDYRRVKLTRPLTLIAVGNEVSGLSPAVLKYCDLAAEIPMSQRKESLNVTVAVGVFLFRLLQS